MRSQVPTQPSKKVRFSSSLRRGCARRRRRVSVSCCLPQWQPGWRVAGRELSRIRLAPVQSVRQRAAHAGRQAARACLSTSTTVRRPSAGGQEPCGAAPDALRVAHWRGCHQLREDRQRKGGAVRGRQQQLALLSCEHALQAGQRAEQCHGWPASWQPCWKRARPTRRAPPPCQEPAVSSLPCRPPLAPSRSAPNSQGRPVPLSPASPPPLLPGAPLNRTPNIFGRRLGPTQSLASPSQPAGAVTFSSRGRSESSVTCALSERAKATIHLAAAEAACTASASAPAAPPSAAGAAQ